MPCYVQRCQGLTLSCLRNCSLARFPAFCCSKVLNMHVKVTSGSLDMFLDSSKISQQHCSQSLLDTHTCLAGVPHLNTLTLGPERDKAHPWEAGW